MIIKNHRFCAKCGTDKDLQEHHIIPKFMGGKDKDGRILLCKKHHAILHSVLASIIWGFVPKKRRELCKKEVDNLARGVYSTWKSQNN